MSPSFILRLNLKDLENMCDQVSIKEVNITLKTYYVHEEDENPPFLLPGRWEIYPYTMMDDLSDTVAYERYRAIVLENKYLRVTVVPDLGGRIYSVYDKIRGMELFYKNSVVKTARVALRGAWISGGVEFNFPNGHTVTTVSPVDYCILKNNDGSCTIFIGDTESVSKMRWCIGITLKPKIKRIEQYTFLYNPTEVRNRFWYWANAAVPATIGLRFETPADWAYCMGKVVKLRGEEKDLTWYRNWDHAVDLFSLNADAEFVGWYLYDLDYGGVHIADKYLLQGKKFFTWGTAESGKMWTKHLTDEDGPYCEVQAGFLQTQYEYELLEPHRAYVFEEFWYPISGLRGLLYANRNLALNIVRQDKVSEIRINSTKAIVCDVLLLSEKEDVILRKGLCLVPETTAVVRLKEDNVIKANALLIRSKRGEEIAKIELKREIKEKPRFEPRPRVVVTLEGSPEELEIAGRYFEEQGETEKAKIAYEKALARDPGYVPALKGLGVLSYKMGKLDRAEAYLRRALNRKRDYEAIYYLALIMKRKGALRLAEKYFGELTRSKEYAYLGYYYLGVCSLVKRKYRESIKFFREALRREPNDVKSLVLMAYALEKIGKRDRARKAIFKALSIDPIYPLALYELYYLSKGTPEEEELIKKVKELIRPPDRVLIKGRPWYEHIVEVIMDYMDIGDLVRAVEVLNNLIKDLENIYEEKYVNPMLYYYEGYIYEKMGDEKQAMKCYMKGNNLGPDYVFPSRIIDEDVLRAVALRTNNWKPYYYLGNLFFAKGRYDEALQKWNEAIKLGGEYSVLYRNIGLAYWRIKYDLNKAMSYYERAIRLDPYNVRAYVELSMVYEIKGIVKKRLELLERAPEDIKRKDYILERLATAYLDAGMYEEALNVLLSGKFRPWEGFYAIRNVYEDVIIAYASQLIGEGRAYDALKILSKYFDYPENLGIGRPSKPSFTRAYYYMALAYEALGDYDSASEFLRRGIKDNPSAFSEDYYYKALCLRKMGNEEDALNAFRRMLDIAMDRISRKVGDNLRNYYMLGLALLGMNMRNEAKRAFRKAISTRIPEEPRSRLGGVLYSLVILRRARWRYNEKLLCTN